MLQPGFEGQVELDLNTEDEVLVRVNQQEFIADLLFMNQFAVCEDCDSTNSWAYYFPNKASETG
jgi:hypothetical protein